MDLERETLLVKVMMSIQKGEGTTVCSCSSASGAAQNRGQLAAHVPFPARGSAMHTSGTVPRRGPRADTDRIVWGLLSWDLSLENTTGQRQDKC